MIIEQIIKDILKTSEYKDLNETLLVEYIKETIKEYYEDLSDKNIKKNIIEIKKGLLVLVTNKEIMNKYIYLMNINITDNKKKSGLIELPEDKKKDK